MPMTEVAAVSAKRKLRLEQNLNGVRYAIESWDGKDPRALIKNIQAMNLDAIDVMKQPDPLLQRISFVVLALQQATDVQVREVNGKRLTRITILDKDLYEWAMHEIHLLPEKLA
jgi:hypothetical protein